MTKQERLIHLANMIINEFEAMQEAENIDNGLCLAQEITKDAVELAKLVKELNETVKE